MTPGIATGAGHRPYVGKFRQLLARGQCFLPGSLVSSTSETDISSLSSSLLSPRYDPGNG